MKNFKEKYQRLNSQQKETVNKIDGPLMVVAGPGSGKTELLSIRAANILKKKDIPPSSILCLTFTDAAAVSMRERLVDLIGEEGYKIPTFTFHSFCKEIIEDHPEYFYKGADYTLADEITKTKILENILDSLEYDNPLTSVRPNFGYTYLRDLKEAISCLKEGGLTPEEFEEAVQHNKEVLEQINPWINNVFDQRVSKSIRPEVEDLVKQLRQFSEDFPLDHLQSLSDVIAASLKESLQGEGTKRITNWKSNWTKKYQGKRVLRDYYYIQKQISLAEIYKEYRERMYQQGFYDFSDMILDVIQVLKQEESLRLDLQERYLYLQVDEFQDTSGVQMRLLRLLTSDEPHNQPNICVVGDDDQAIYRFQGADISNILDFKDFYQDPEVITLIKNYRSREEIVEASRQVITKGEHRLENKLEEVEKDLVPETGEGGEVVWKEFNTKQEEYSFVAERIQELIKEGIDPEEIAVIARTHKRLKEINPYFEKKQISTFAERKENVLEKEPIVQIIQIVRFAVYLLEGDRKKAENLLPEILSYDFWEIEREKIWKLARRAYEQRISWLEAIEDREVQKVKDFLVDLSTQAKTKPSEEILDIIIGNKQGTFQSPFKQYYFGNQEDKKENDYFGFLSSLKAFMDSVKEFEEARPVKAEDLLDFINTHEDNNIPILDKNPLLSGQESVSLITAHSAKGKEFEAVFILSCKHEVWGKTRRGSKLPFQSNMPLEKAGENRDDQLRLFYVAITRAKKFLALSSHEKKENGRKYSPLQFVSHLNKTESERAVTESDLEASWESYHSPPIVHEEEKLLQSVVENYQLSPTGFNKFLNVVDEGPQSFLEETLLRFPSKKPIPASFGTAVHETLKEAHTHLKEEGQLPTEEEFLNAFTKHLENERLAKEDYKKQLSKGRDALEVYYNRRIETISPEDISEKSFRNQGCVVSDYKLTGKIDRINVNNSKAKLIDYKTGSPLESWDPSGKYNKIKAWKYKNQLLFYKILMEDARDFKGVQADEGLLEFIEPNDDNSIVTLPLEFTHKETKRLKALIKIIGQKIHNLEFPDTEDYSQKSIKSIKQFESDLLEGQV